MGAFVVCGALFLLIAAIAVADHLLSRGGRDC
jgi:hypothetical protein